MTQSGVPESTQRTVQPLPVRGLGVRDWSRFSAAVPGPLLTLALMIGLDLLARAGMPVVHPFPILLLAVAWSAYRGGSAPGLVSAVLTTLYAVHFLAYPIGGLRYDPVGAYTLLLIGTVSVALALLVARLQAAARRGRGAVLEREEVEAIDRRLTFLAEASSVLASSLDYEVTLRSLSRLAVPSLADWSTIHVAREGGAMHFVAGSHRDPARDLVVRVLADTDDGRVPFGQPGESPRLLSPTDQDLRALAPDPDRLRIYRTLAPTSVVQIPIRARGQLIGVINLVASREYGRVLVPADLDLARELGQRVSLAVENARLYRDSQEADRRYRALFDAHPQPMWAIDVDTLAFLEVNDAAVRFYGYSREEFLAMTIMDLRPPDDLPGPPTGLGGERRPEVALAQHQRKNGSIVDMEIISHEMDLGGRRARLVLATDVTDRARTRAALQRSEDQLRQVQRMDIVGRLASGVAHDFNNLLTTIRGFSELLLQELPQGDRRYADVEQIRRAAERGTLLTRQLLAFSRRQPLEPRVLSLGGVLRTLDGLVRRLVGADIELEIREGPDIGAVRMDAGQLEQVIVNLVLNARDAMPAGGTLRIATAERQVAGAGGTRHLRAGRYVVLIVSDTGSALDPESLNEVFDSGTSAPPHAPRAGLGLSIVYGIVRRCGGAVRISSEPGQGTTVKVYLPRVEPDVAELDTGPADELRGTETVLVAEDEDGVRELLRKVLTEHGHTVLEARHGRDALMLAERYERPIHLLVTDVVMPEMGGPELAQRLVERRPDLQVIYVSGYTNDEVLRRGIPEEGAAFVQKPFASEDLMRRVREVLDAASRVT